jgi:two-component system NtrC family sensor kinase
MSNSNDYKEAYERQKLARQRAEATLEERTRELYLSNVALQQSNAKLRNQQIKLLHQEKLASIGLLAAGVAHEINNPISFVKSNLEVLSGYLLTLSKLLIPFKSVANRAYADPEAIDYRKELESLIILAKESDLVFLIEDSLESVKESLTGADRVKDIVVNLRDFSRSDTDPRALCSLNEIIDSILKVLSGEIKNKIKIEKDFSELPPFYAYVGQLSQVFINIIMNAVQALPVDEKLKIVTRKEEENIRIDFIDSGPGISEENLGKLFDPFFTTKDVGEGTGLGLYITHNIINRHSGTIEAHNNKDGGACFSITLPIDIRTESRS